VFGPVLTHFTFDLLHRVQAIEERMFFAGESMVAVFLCPGLDPGPLAFEIGLFCSAG
jgi:hypothetical protein